MELQQLKEELAQHPQQPRSRHLEAHGQRPGQNGDHVNPPPVLPLSGRRLLPDADHEIGFGVHEVRHALYDMGEELRRQVGQAEELWKREVVVGRTAHECSTLERVSSIAGIGLSQLLAYQYRALKQRAWHTNSMIVIHRSRAAHCLG